MSADCTHHKSPSLSPSKYFCFNIKSFSYIFFIAANFVEHLQFLSYIYLYRDEIHLSKNKFSDQKSLDFVQTICFLNAYLQQHFISYKMKKSPNVPEVLFNETSIQLIETRYMAISFTLKT